MTTIVFDTESDGFRDESTVVHCIVLKPLLEGSERPCEAFSARPLSGTLGSIQNGLQRLSEASLLIGQNIIQHDLPLLKRLYDWEPSPETRIFDTLVVSRLLNPDRTTPAGYTGKGGPHSIEAWGYRLGRYKPEHEDWKNLSPAMLRRCSEDVEINTLLYHTLLEEIGNHDWWQAIEIEHAVAQIMLQQELNGVLFDSARARFLVDDLTQRIQSIDDRLLPDLPKKLIIPYDKPIEAPFKKDGTLSTRASNWLENQADDCGGPRGIRAKDLVGGPFSRIRFDEINLGSQEQVKNYLLSIGWQPTEWNYKDGEKTSPKLTEDSFESIEGPLGAGVKERTLISHRRSQIEGLLGKVRADGRIAAKANTCGTNTGRMRHIDVVNIPKASHFGKYLDASKTIPHPKAGQIWYSYDEEYGNPPIFLGSEIRSLFTVPEDKVLVGHDASGLELRMLAHYMNDKEFTEALIYGDIHTRNQELAGLPTRDGAKTFIYGFLYGAGDEKIGRIVGGTSRDGADLRKKFLSNLPALKRLIDRCKRASNKGWLKGLDGRKVWMRGQEHKALNTLLQSAGAIVMKKSMIILDQSVREAKLDVKKVIDMHDEAQAEVHPDHVELYKQLAVESIVKAGQHFKLNCPLAGEAKVGRNWASTH